jgi:hypothetical protein
MGTIVHLDRGSLQMSPKPGYVAPSREGKVPLTIYVDRATRQSLKMAALAHETTLDAMMQDAIAATLKKYPLKGKG